MNAIAAAADIARLLLAAILILAAAGKLMDLRGGERSARELGVPARLAWPVTIVVPPIELALAVGLIVPSTARAAAVAAAFLLGAFAVVVGTHAARGQSVDCGCFGSLYRSRTNTPAAIRTAALALVAAWIGATEPGGTDWSEIVTAAAIAVLVAQAVGWIVLLRRYGRALRRVETLEKGSGGATPLAAGDRAPAFTLGSHEGTAITLQDLVGRGLPLLLVFADPNCGPCRALMPTVAGWQRDLSRQATVVVVSDGEPAGNLTLMDEYGVREVLSQPGRDVSRLFGVQATPSAVLVDGAGRIERLPVAGAVAIEEMVTSAFGESASLPRGTAAKPALVAAVGGALAVAPAAANAHPASHAGAPAPDPVVLLTGAVRRTRARLATDQKRLRRAMSYSDPADLFSGSVAPYMAPAARGGEEGARWGAAVITAVAVEHPAKSSLIAYFRTLASAYRLLTQAALTTSPERSRTLARRAGVLFGGAAAEFDAADQDLGCPFGCTTLPRHPARPGVKP